MIVVFIQVILMKLNCFSIIANVSYSAKKNYSFNITRKLLEVILQPFQNGNNNLKKIKINTHFNIIISIHVSLYMMC